MYVWVFSLYICMNIIYMSGAFVKKKIKKNGFGSQIYIVYDKVL